MHLPFWRPARESRALPGRRTDLPGLKALLSSTSTAAFRALRHDCRSKLGKLCLSAHREPESLGRWTHKLRCLEEAKVGICCLVLLRSGHFGLPGRTQNSTDCSICSKSREPASISAIFCRALMATKLQPGALEGLGSQTCTDHQCLRCRDHNQGEDQANLKLCKRNKQVSACLLRIVTSHRASQSELLV